MGTTTAPWRPSRAAIVLCGMLAVAAGVAGARWWKPAWWGRYAGYPELCSVSPEEVAALDEHDPTYGLREWDGRGRAGGEPDRRWLLDAHLRDLGPRAGLVVAALWLDRDRDQDPRFPFSVLDAASEQFDAPSAWWLQRNSRGEADAVLRRIAADRSRHCHTRTLAAAGLCRPANSAALGVLGRIALDREESPALRGGVVLRVPRIGQLPGGLDELLDVPLWDLDRYAAGALGACGHLEAPTLVLAGLRRFAKDDRHFVLSLEELDLHVAAVRRSVDDPVIRALADAAQVETSRLASLRMDRRDLAGNPRPSEAVRELVEALGPWVERRNATAPSAWERTRREYLESDGRRRELRLRTIDDVAAAVDAEIDVAAAAQFLLKSPEEAEAVLEDLDRVARWLRPRLADCPSPREKLERMQSLLVRSPQMTRGAEDPSDVSTVLREGAGNCLGWTVTFVVLGDRLGLPLHAVDVPGHVYLRWDDARDRIDFDVTLADPWADDARASREWGGAERLRATGRYLRNLTRKELVSLSLSNAAAGRVGRTQPDGAPAADLARQALRVDPGNVSAAVILAGAEADADPPRADAVRAAVAAAEQSRAFTTAHAAACAQSLLEVGEAGAALALLDRHPLEAGSAAAHDLARASALWELGRREETEPVLERLLSVAPDDPHAAALRVTAAFTRGRDDAAREVAAAAERGCSPAVVGLGAAKRLLGDHPGSVEAARLALEILSPLDDFARAFGRARSRSGDISDAMFGARRAVVFLEGEKQELERLRAAARERTGEESADGDARGERDD